jgi:hypothetical protein
LGGHGGWVGADCPRGEAEYAFAGDPQVVLAAHVRPRVAYLHVLAAVDLDVYLPLLEQHVQVAPSARRVVSNDLPSRFRQPVPAAQVEEVDLGERVRATDGVVHGLANQAVPAGARQPVEDGSYLLLADQSLLDAGRDDRPRLTLCPRPMGRVHQRPRRSRPGRPGRGQHVSVIQNGAAVHDDSVRHAAGSAAARQEDVDHLGGESPQAQRGEAT